ncbi:hypothetical protein ACCT09_54575, partial [Rhizobium ruizarguesonis]
STPSAEVVQFRPLIRPFPLHTVIDLAHEFPSRGRMMLRATYSVKLAWMLKRQRSNARRCARKKASPCAKNDAFPAYLYSLLPIEAGDEKG